MKTIDIYFNDRYESKGCASCGNGVVKTYGLVATLKFNNPSNNTIAILKAKPMQEVQTTSLELMEVLLRYDETMAKEVQLLELYDTIIQFPKADIKIFLNNVA